MKNKLVTQRDNFKHLLELVNSNPDLPIMPMVDSEIVADDCHGWWVGGWGNASIEDVWNNDERIYIRSEVEDTLIDEVSDNICDEPDYANLTDEEFRNKARSIVDSYNWKTVIAVRINLP